MAGERRGKPRETAAIFINAIYISAQMPERSIALRFPANCD
jgi:hypothetical protein